jgi:hypothetical protein
MPAPHTGLPEENHYNPEHYKTGRTGRSDLKQYNLLQNTNSAATTAK